MLRGSQPRLQGLLAACPCRNAVAVEALYTFAHARDRLHASRYKSRQSQPNQDGGATRVL
jgi:hypothetical protein